MLDFVRTFFAVIAAILFLTFLPIVALVAMALLQHHGPRPDSWLVVRLQGELLEYYGPTTIHDLLDQPPPCLMEITENLEKAAADDRILGVILRIEPFAAGTGKLDEMRAGLAGVRAAGKPTYAWAQELDDAGVYLASACDSTFLFPDGRVYLLGRGATIEHVKGSLEKLDVHDNFHVIDEYKTAAEFFTEKESSAEALENLHWLVNDVAAAWDSTLAAGRGLDPSGMDSLRAHAIFRAEDAMDAALVDGLAYWDELEDRLRGPAAHLATISSQDYADVDRASLGLAGRTRVAVVHGQGFIASDGEDRYDPAWGIVMGPDRVIEDLERAREDRGVDAILLRWDSSGGATDGSARIARAVERARREKPVVVSIADVAASGGYMISYPANRIVCPGSGVTGSIGSITGKLNVRGFWEKLGVSFDDAAFAPNAFLFSDLHDWTMEQRELVAEEHWAFYRAWIEDIAEARSVSPAYVDENARGRVWTGRQALARGLVDDLGGFHESVDALRETAEFAPDEKLAFEHWPKEQTLMDILLSGDLGRVAQAEAVTWARRAILESRAGSGALLWQPIRLR